MPNNSSLSLEETIVLFYQNHNEYYVMSNSQIIIIITIFGIISIIGCIENIYTLYIILSRKKLRIIRNIFIANLAFTDLIICVIVEPLNVYQIIVNEWKLGAIMCRV
ncbi:hypothetical protein A3Q56_04557 [Intoshia linei]|uniref:G-protein coupled receptors family 1 profile domain-containing protein n=1 Tax=Intoshia linei TaxID=1819745 RepID=A0A177B1U5_9BILA|nr:hypothetical protein A3Q56_04557 [Intoshia linei]